MSKRSYYNFDCFRIDPIERVLLRDDKPVSLSPKVFDTLLALVEHSGHIVSKDELVEIVWPDTFVEENNLTQYVAAVRRALGDNRQEQKYIDEQYTVYLEKQRRSNIVAALSAKQQQLEQTSLRNEIEHVPVPPQRPKLLATPRTKPACDKHLFSCEWPKLSESLHELRKKLFGMSSSKAKRS